MAASLELLPTVLSDPSIFAGPGGMLITPLLFILIDELIGDHGHGIQGLADQGTDDTAPLLGDSKQKDAVAGADQACHANHLIKNVSV